MNKLNLPYVSVVLSFWNEADVIPELLQRLRSVFHEAINDQKIRDYELIFVNDDSTDNSLELLKLEITNNNDVRVLNMSRNFGVSPCVLAGMEYSSGDLIIYMDADLQDPPEVIPAMLEKWYEDKTTDVIHTRRLSRDGESKFKLAITKLGYFILNKVTSINLPVETGDFKMLSRRTVDQLLQLKEKRPFIRGMVCWVGYNQKSIFYNRDPRGAGETKFPVLSARVISNFFSSALISFSSFPLKISAYLGIFSSLIGVIVFLHIIIEKIQGHNIPGWTAIMAAILFFGSIQLITTGILGLYLLSVFEESKKRPNYIVESALGFKKTE